MLTGLCQIWPNLVEIGQMSAISADGGRMSLENAPGSSFRELLVYGRGACPMTGTAESMLRSNASVRRRRLRRPPRDFDGGL